MATAQPLNGEMIPPGVTETSQSLTETFSPASLLSIALENNAAIDVIERLAALQEKTMLRDAEILFNDALSRIQAEVKRVAPDLQNPSTSSKYASYAAIDRVIRPIYTKECMSLSFSHADCPKPDHVRVLCFASLGAYTRTYQIDMPSDGKGAKGGDVMTKTHATATADSYAKRYLVKDIFNIAIGEDDTDGNLDEGIPQQRVDQMCSWIANAPDENQLRNSYFTAVREARAAKDRSAEAVYIRVKDARKRELSR
jgi:hypothetical protein